MVWRKLLLLLFCIQLCTGITSAYDFTWNYNGADNWTSGTRWTHVGGGTYPDTGDTAYIAQGTVTANTNVGSNVNLSGGRLQTTGTLKLNLGTAAAPITVLQTGGTLAPILETILYGDYTLSGGQIALSTRSFYIGYTSGTANMLIDGGSVTGNAGSALTVGLENLPSSLSARNGSVNISTVNIQNGTFRHTGPDTITSVQTLAIGSLSYSAS